jgi:methylated-DNA-protein-cysteine methyltransferase-like protein
MASDFTFSQRVWQLAAQIPPGKVTTYALLTVTAGGHPMLARMITSILSKCPDQKSIPYHRIVYATGRVWLTPEIEASRRRLYQEEGIVLDSKNRIINFESHLYQFK